MFREVHPVTEHLGMLLQLIADVGAEIPTHLQCQLASPEFTASSNTLKHKLQTH